MADMLWRILIAVIVCIALFALLPPVFAVIGFPNSENVQRIFRVVIGALALLYIITGGPVRRPWGPV